MSADKSSPREPLVRPLFEGPLDIVGDIHGEIESLESLLRHLGYAGDGDHPRNRRLVFLGDLVDRGPDSPAVVAMVSRLVETGRAQCVLGNHELNALLGKRKPHNVWLYGRTGALDHSAVTVPQALASPETRRQILDFFGRLPLALARDDLRIVHACWEPAAVEHARQADSTAELHNAWAARIDEDLHRQGQTDPAACELTHQNQNPVKALTSGLEQRARVSFEAGGRLRELERVRWWQQYSDPVFCVFGHYWRTPVPGEKDEAVFTGCAPHATLGSGQAMCIDYSVGARWKERLHPEFRSLYQTQLAALQWPERRLVFDDGTLAPLIESVR